MNYVIQFTPEAENTFDSLTKQLLARWGIEYVYSFEDQIVKALDILAETPLLYPVIAESTQIRKCILHKNCSLLYKVIDSTVLVICFWDNRQEPLFT